jgi:diguanylate cyclase (GGDEF)-like protein
MEFCVDRLNRIPLLGGLIARARAFDWSRRAVRDGIVIFGLVLALYAVSDAYNVPPKLFQFATDHADWDVDDAIFVVFTVSLALLVFIFRRLQDLNQEIKARRRAEEAARKMARHDPLTGLPNRRYFNEKLEEALHSIATEGRRGAVLMLDLDGFKAVNDVHGHLIGDKVLTECAERIKIAARGALVARVGGDEFSIVMPDIHSLDEPTGLARRISRAVAEPFKTGDSETTLGVGIGISIAPDDGTTSDDLVRRADVALYRAKATGSSLTRFFEPAMDTHVERRTTIERELRAAIAAQSVEVYYQPQVHLDGGRIIGFEALARWNSPALGAVPPDVFIAVAEECGLIHRLGDQLLHTACRDAARWPGEFTLAFNISPLQLRDASFGLRVLAILGETGFPPTRLELEITESAIVGDANLAQRLIDELRTAGVRIALDDFGTGYATMSQLLAFRFDKIKIDRSFVMGLGSQPGNEVIVRAIIGLAKGLGLVTTAEGIELPGQLADLITDGCQEGQGYLFGKAMPAGEIPALLAHPRLSEAVA